MWKHIKKVKLFRELFSKKLPFGLIIELAKDVRGLLHRNEYSWNPNDNFQDFVKIGETVEVQIVGFDKAKERIALSRKSIRR